MVLPAGSFEMAMRLFFMLALRRAARPAVQPGASPLLPEYTHLHFPARAPFFPAPAAFSLAFSPAFSACA
jgi:hypothetical protein